MYFVSFVVKHKSLNHKAFLSDVRQTGITKVKPKNTKEEYYYTTYKTAFKGLHKGVQSIHTGKTNFYNNH